MLHIFFGVLISTKALSVILWCDLLPLSENGLQLCLYILVCHWIWTVLLLYLLYWSICKSHVLICCWIRCGYSKLMERFFSHNFQSVRCHIVLIFLYMWAANVLLPVTKPHNVPCPWYHQMICMIHIQCCPASDQHTCLKLLCHNGWLRALSSPMLPIAACLSL